MDDARSGGWTGAGIGSAARVVAGLLVLAAVAAIAGGCGQQQAYERNDAMRRQYEEVYRRNLELERRLYDLERKAAARPEPVALPAAAPADLGPPPITVSGPAPEPMRALPRPDFGPGVEVRTSGDTVSVTVSDQVLFSSGSATLRDPAKAVLDNVANVLNRDYPAHRIRVEGHTDNEPIRKTRHLWKDNWELSFARATAVSQYLNTRGVDARRIQTAGYGETRPVASNNTVEGRSKNRRVEIVVSPR